MAKSPNWTSDELLAKILGLGCAKIVVRWIEAGWLKGRLGHRVGLNRARWISEDDLVAFLEDRRHWQRWHPERITDERWRGWAQDLRAADPFWTVGQVAERMGVDQRRINEWIRSGELAAQRNGNWHVPESVLRAFVPQLPAPRASDRWTHDQVTEGLNLRCQGLSFSEIDRRLGRRPGSSQYRLKAALVRRPLWKAVRHAVDEFGGRAAVIDIARTLDGRGIFRYDHQDIYGAVRDAAARSVWPRHAVRNGVIYALRWSSQPRGKLKLKEVVAA